MGKRNRVGIDIGELFGLAPILSGIFKGVKKNAAMPKGPERRAANKALWLGEIEALLDWADKALED